MPARLRPFNVRSHRPIQKGKKRRDDWQKLADERTANQFEQYLRMKRRSRSIPRFIFLDFSPKK
jgi:hypothetical protein